MDEKDIPEQIAYVGGAADELEKLVNFVNASLTLNANLMILEYMISRQSELDKMAQDLRLRIVERF